MNCNSKQRSGVLRITQGVDYGIILLATLAKNGKTNLSIKNIAEENQLSFSFTQKVAGLLRQSELIKAERGKYGGYSLARKPEELALKDIIEAIEGKVAIVPCLKESEGKICSHFQSCKARPGFKKINNEIRELILSKSLTHLIS